MQTTSIEIIAQNECIDSRQKTYGECLKKVNDIRYMLKSGEPILSTYNDNFKKFEVRYIKSDKHIELAHDEYLKTLELKFNKAISRLEQPRINSEEDVNKIWNVGRFLTKKWDWEIYEPTKPDELTKYITILLEKTNKGSGDKICDLGIGTSFVQATFAALGFKTYGVDISNEALEYSKPHHEKVQEELRFRYRYRPINAMLDVCEPNISSFKFSDGTLMKEMDVFFWNIGHANPWEEEVINNFKDIKNCIWMTTSDRHSPEWCEKYGSIL